MCKRPAFTLIELLVVIAILALLASLLFSVFAQARERARTTVCMSNLKQIGTATLMYIQDFDETYPSGWIPGANGAPSGMTIWRVVLQPYIQKYGDQSNFLNNNGDFGVFSDPDVPAGHGTNGPTSFGYNAAASGLTNGWNNAAPLESTNHYVGKAQAALRRPANVVAYCDAAQIATEETMAADPNWREGDDPTRCTGYETNNGAKATGPCGPFAFRPKVWKAQNPWASVDWDFGVPGLTGDGDWNSNGARRPHARHAGKINAVFADGHAKPVDGDTLKARLGTPEDVWHDHD